MKAAKLREQSREELVQMLENMSKEIFDLRFKKGIGGEAEQPLRIRALRRDRARVNTVIREKEQGAVKHG